MATIEFVTALITLWNESRSIKVSIEGFKEFMAGQTVTVLNGQTFYYYGDVSRYLHGSEVVD